MAGVAVGGTGFALAVTGAPNGVPLVEPRGGEHAPVLRDAAIDSLAIRADGCYVDATFGRGGHAGEILGRLGEEGSLIAFDRDPEAAAAAAVLFSGDARARFVRAPFRRHWMETRWDGEQSSGRPVTRRPDAASKADGVAEARRVDGSGSRPLDIQMEQCDNQDHGEAQGSRRSDRDRLLRRLVGREAEGRRAEAGVSGGDEA